MCKKILSGLFGGGDQEEIKPPAQMEANYSKGKEGDVKGAVVQGVGDNSSSTKLGGGLQDERKRRKQGVPGLGL